MRSITSDVNSPVALRRPYFVFALHTGFRWSKQMGARRRTMARLRHTWASRLTMSGADPRTPQTLGGWRSLSMVERYSHLSPDHLRSAVEKLGAPTLRLEATASPVSQSEARPEPSRAPELDSNLTRLQDEASRAS